ncbi:hypothetical protein ACN6K5_003623 [Streptomyces violaceoruber]|uniref:hypothetical protein n=1 Tax=Streptomyces violaceoruber TaxID=1935 RepID=UPI00403C7AF5
MPDSVVVSLVVLLFVLAVSAVGTVLYVRRERRRPSSYRSRWAAEMAEWHALPTEVQAAHDEAALHAGEAAEIAAARVSGLPRP